MGLIDKVTLRSIISMLSISSLIFLIIYIVIRSDIEIKIGGVIDISQIITAFLTIISVVLGWLFGRSK